MSVNMEIVEKLGDAVDEFVRDWAKHNIPGGTLEANDVVSALIGYAGAIIANHPDREKRAHFVCNAVGALVGIADADVAVATYSSAEAAMDSVLAHVKPEGNA